MTIRGPYGFVAEVAPGADPSASPSTWDFTSEGVRWRQRSGITISGGRDDESDDIEAGSFAATFDARDGRLSPRNVLGPWYGKIGTNTPIRLMLPVANDQFDRTVAAGGLGFEPLSGAGWSTANGAFMSVSGSAARVTIPTQNSVATGTLNRAFGSEVDIVSTSSLSALPVGGNYVHAIVVRRVDASNFYRVHTEYTTAGTVAVKVSRTAANAITDLADNFATGVTYAANTLIRTRVRTIGRSIQVKVWQASGSEPAAWQLTASDDVVDGDKVGIWEWRIGTSAVTLSVQDFVARAAVYTGQVPEWPIRWPSKSGADAITPVAASGILRWLKQGQPPLEAPIPQQLSAYNPQSYWRLDEGTTSTSAGNSIPFGFPMQAVDVSFGNDDAPPGAVASASLNSASTSRLSGGVRQWSLPKDDGGLIFYVRLSSLPAANATLMEMRTAGDLRRWVVSCSNNAVTLTVIDAVGSTAFVAGPYAYTVDPTKWWAINVEYESIPGGSIQWGINWHQVGSTTFYGQSSSYPAVVERPTDITFNAPSDNTLVSNVWVGPSSVPFVDGGFAQVSSGFAGETDVARIRRVFGYAGIEVFTAPGSGRRLGPQPRNATPLDVARDAEQGGFGVLYERGAISGYIPWSARVNVPVTMALDWAAGHLDEAPEPTDDDQRLVNRWTSSRPDGGSRVAEDAASIARKRLYSDGAEVNVERDEQLADDAGWHVAIGALDALRWPRIKINLSRNPSLIFPWLACRIGSRITIANLPGQVAGEVADLLVEGFEQVIDTDYEWTVEISCSPARPWVEVGVWGESRGDSQTAELVTARDAVATAWSVRARLYEDTWANPAAPGDYSVVAAGEVMPVVSATAPVLSGGYWTQTVNVTRGGPFAKAHAAGEPIRLAEPKRWGMGY